MKLDETRISIGGTFRCCLSSVASEYLNKEVEIGNISECKYCHEKFILEDDKMWRVITDETNQT